MGPSRHPHASGITSATSLNVPRTKFIRSAPSINGRYRPSWKVCSCQGAGWKIDVGTIVVERSICIKNSSLTPSPFSRKIFLPGAESSEMLDDVLLQACTSQAGSNGPQSSWQPMGVRRQI